MKRKLHVLLAALGLFVGTSVNAQTISQTNNQAPTAGTVACSETNQQNQQFIRMMDNAYSRAYTMTSAVSISAVRIGVGTVNGNFPITVKLYESNGAYPASYPTGLTQLATATYTLTSNDDLTLVDIPFSSAVSVASGDIIVAEISHPEGVANDGLRFYMGIATSQTTSGYLRSNGCQIATPTDMITINATARPIIDLITGTVSSEDFFKDQFTMYPNPVTDVLNITSVNGLNANEIRIMDLTGKVIKVQNNASSVNVADLAAGAYLIEVATDEGKATSKFIKK